MRRRRFLVTTASAMAVAPFAGLAGCGNGSSNGGDGPQPVPESDVVLRLPEDMYLHLGSPTEWWWHTGTLRSGDRIFGFEINAASFAGNGGFAFHQIMLTDVATGRHFKRTTPFVPFVFDANHWAQSDPSRDWYARLGDPASSLSAIEVLDPGSGYTADPTVEISGGGGSGAMAITRRDASGGIANVLLIVAGSGYTSSPTVTIHSKDGNGSGATARALHTFVTMDAPASDPTQNMRVQALLDDDPTHEQVRFDLLLSQQGRPFFVWGTGITPGGDPSGGTKENNYYFSLTRLAASGTIEVGGERFEVEGVTWMDHEYGAFGTTTEPVKWILQDMQLDNGVCISNFLTHQGELMKLNERSPSYATVQEADGTTYFVETFMTAVGRTWTSDETGATYFMEFRVELPSFDADLHVVTLVDSQEFPVPGASVYEGVAEATGTFRGKCVRGTAWNEQEL
jgi:predicted secreted hydrolase